MKARLPAGMGGGPQNQKDLMRKAQQMQEQLAQTQAALEEKEFTVTSGGGMVEVVINGKRELKKLEIKPEIVDPDDIEMLSDVIMAAVNEAIRKVEDVTNEEMSKLTGSFNMPGMPGLF